MASRGRRAIGAAGDGGRAFPRSPRGKTSPRVALGPFYEPCVPLAVIAEGLGPRRARAGRMCGLRVRFAEAPVGTNERCPLDRYSEACAFARDILALAKRFS